MVLNIVQSSANIPTSDGGKVIDEAAEDCRVEDTHPLSLLPPLSLLDVLELR